MANSKCMPHVPWPKWSEEENLPGGYKDSENWAHFTRWAQNLLDNCISSGGCCPAYCTYEEMSFDTGEGNTSFSFADQTFDITAPCSVAIHVTFHVIETTNGSFSDPAILCTGQFYVDGSLGSQLGYASAVQPPTIQHLACNMTIHAVHPFSSGSSFTVTPTLTIEGDQVQGIARADILVTVHAIGDDDCLGTPI